MRARLRFSFPARLYAAAADHYAEMIRGEFLIYFLEIFESRVIML